MNPELARIVRALRPLDQAPGDLPWNRDMLADVMPPRLREAAVLVGLVDRAQGAQLLFTRRTDHLRHHAGEVSFPGGALEPQDVDAVAAALRETAEEVGVADAEIEPLGFLDPMLTVTGFRVLPVVARIDPDYRPRPDPQEVAEVFELPLAHALAPGSLFHRQMPWQGRVRAFAELRPCPGIVHARVWGATAMIVENLRRRLEHLP